MFQRPRLVPLLALAALPALIIVAPAAAYVRTSTSTGLPVYWNRSLVTTTVYVGAPPPDLNESQIMFAVSAAAAAWSRSSIGCTSAEIRVVPSLESSAEVKSDRTSRLTFRRQEWCKEPRKATEACYDRSVLAVTSVFARTGDGEILDADIEVNAVDYTWSDLVATPPSSDPSADPVNQDTHDLQATLTHEFGHLIGLDHTCHLAGMITSRVDHKGQTVPSCLDANTPAVESIMGASVNQGDTSKRVPGTDDREAVCAIYPAIGPTLETSGCSFLPHAPTTSSLAALALAAAALGISCARRRRRAVARSLKR